MQHQETSRWQQLKQVDILAMDLHTPDTVSYTHCAIDRLPSHDAMESCLTVRMAKRSS